MALDAPHRDKAKYRSALSWSVAMVGGQQFISATVSFFLAAYLGPSAFGTVAMATIYVLFMQMLLQQAIPAIVQRRNLDPEHLDSAFWIVQALTLGITLVSIALAGPWAAANDNPELQWIIVALSLQVPLLGLVVVQEAVLRREMKFRSLAGRELSACVVGGAVGLGTAIMGAGVWALVWQQLANSLVDAVVLWKVSNWRPHLRFSRSHAKDLLGFSIAATLASLAAFINIRSDATLIGLFFGAYAVGLYRLASRFTEIFVDFLSRSMQQVAFPELSRLQTNLPVFARRQRDILKQSSLMTLPALGILAGCAVPLLRIFGPEWQGAAVPLQLLCVAAGLRALTLISAAGIQAIGRPNILAILSWVAAGVSAVSLVAVGVWLGGSPVTDQVVGMAASRAAVLLVVIGPMFVYVLDKYCGLPPLRLLGAIGGPAAVGLAVAAVGILWDSTGAYDSWSPIVALGATGIITVAMAVLLLSVVARPEFVRALSLIGRVVTTPSWVPGYRPQHIQQALVENSLITSGDTSDYIPRHLAQSRSRRPSPADPPPTVAHESVTYTEDAGHEHPEPKSGQTTSAQAQTNSERPGGWSHVDLDDNQRHDLLRGALTVDLWTSLGVMVRRWVVAAPILVLTAIASFVIGGSVSPDYKASTTVLLVGPGNGAPPASEAAAGATTTAPTTATTAAPAATTTTAGNSPVQPNPLLGLSQSLNSIARATVESINDDSVARRLSEAGLSTDYEITVAQKDPIMQIVVTSTSSEEAIETLNALKSTLSADLQARQDQAGATAQSRIQVQTLAETNQPRAIYEGRRRAQLVIVALGLIAAAAGAFIAEGFAQRRSGLTPDDRPASANEADGPRREAFAPDENAPVSGSGYWRGTPGGAEGSAGRSPSGAGAVSFATRQSSGENGYGDDGNGDRWR
jgi:O-antigen/teichoic acid export membrane protein/capsular polysaccharide biosynthesis protein